MSKQSARHTPGPWVIDKLANTHVVSATGRGVANCGSYFTNSDNGEYLEENDANTRLISAAPELMEALERSDKQMERAGDCIEAGRYDEALLHVRSMSRQRKAAIAKARATHD